MTFYTFIVDDVNHGLGQDLQEYLAANHDDYFLCYHGDSGRCPTRGPHWHIVLPGPLDGNPACIASRCRFYRRYQERTRISGRRTYGIINNFIEYLLRPPRLLTAHKGIFLRIVAGVRAAASTGAANVLPAATEDATDAPPPSNEQGRRRGRPTNAMSAAERNGQRAVERANQKAGLKGEELRILQDLVVRSHAKSKGALVRWVKKHGSTEEWTFVYDVLTAKGMRDFDTKFRTAIQLCEMEYLDQSWEDLLKQCSDDLFPSERYHSVGTSRQLISRWFNDQDIDIWKFVEGTIPIFDKSRKKKNTVVLHGEKNSGKTLIDKRSMLIEELVIGPTQTEEMKSVMGGEPVMIQVKCKNQAYLDRTPVVITCNTFPWCSVGGGPIYEARCTMYKNLREMSWLANYTKKIHPRVWLYYVETICESQRRFATDMEMVLEAASPTTEGILPEIPLRYIVNLDTDETNEAACRQEALNAITNFNNITEEQLMQGTTDGVLPQNRALIADMEWFFGHPTQRDIEDAELALYLTPHTVLAPDTPMQYQNGSRYDNMPNYSPADIEETPPNTPVMPVNYYGSPIAEYTNYFIPIEESQTIDIEETPQVQMPPPRASARRGRTRIRQMLQQEPEGECSDDEQFEL